MGAQRRITACGRLVLLILPLVLVLGFQGYVVAVQGEGDLPLPKMFGNFERIRKTLEEAPAKEEFTFAVVGDTRGADGTFEEIIADLRIAKPDFVVLLGDCAEGTEHYHRYFRAEIAEECALPCPMFYIAGNHDIHEEFFPLPRFEELYGPAVFSFQYQGRLFIALNGTNTPPSEQANLEFLKTFLPREAGQYRRVFVFMHVPPPLPFFDSRKFRASAAYLPLFHELKVDYVFASHYHGFGRIELAGTTYVISGGGGARLDHSQTGYQQFHHGIIVDVGQDHASERIIQPPRGHHLEDELERFAIAQAWPWMFQNWEIVCPLNVVLLLATLGACHRWRTVSVTGH